MNTNTDILLTPNPLQIRFMKDLEFLDATAQAQLIADGRVTSLELVDAAIARIEKHNQVINAVISTDFERAREQARASADSTSPFAGVPFLLKDINANQAGLPQWLGNRVLKQINHRSAADTVLGGRFRQAGLITLGKTNMPEMGSGPVTQPESCGPTNNPWNLEYSPSGSSGGSAAAVAAGMVSIAHASDGGGSTRLPAAWCGLVGLKPSRGRMPNPLGVSRFLAELAVTRTVRDTARLLDAVHGAVDADYFNLGRPERPYVEELGAPVSPLRIGLMTAGNELGVDDECVAGAEAVAAVLSQMGHAVIPAECELMTGEQSLVNNRVFPFNTAANFRVIERALGRAVTEEDVEPFNWAVQRRASAVTALEFGKASESQQQWAVEVIEWCRSFDVLLTPTAGCPPMRTADLVPPADKPWKIGYTYRKITQYTLPFNVTGQPAISLPLHRSSEGLPVGIQLVGHMGREDLLIRLAAQLEEAMPWSHPGTFTS